MESLLRNHENVFIISAPSGAGKTSLCSALLKRHPSITVAISHTTRQPREGELHGREYYFVDKLEFEKMIANNEFLEYANVYGNSYGTSIQSISNCLQLNKQVILEIDWQGAQKVRSRAPSVQSVFILPPSLNDLENRLTHRGKDNQQVIDKRLLAALEDISHYREYDYILINDNFEHALDKLERVFAGGFLGDSEQDIANIISQFQKT